MSSSGMIGFGRILVCFDGSEGALRACELAAVLAKSCGSDVTVLHVIPSLSIFTTPLADEYYAYHQKEAKKMVERAASSIEKHGVKVRTEILQARASVVQTIVEYAADKRSDIIVMGTRGLGGFKKMLIGSISSGAVAHAHCPVLVVK